MALYIDEF